MSHPHVEASAGGAIDLDVVREMMSHFTPQDHQEAQELILSALQEINEHFGYVSLDAAEIVAERLGTTATRIYGLLTFYADFRTEPRGRNFMLVCNGMACYVMGAQKLIEELKDRYGVVDGGTTADGQLTVQIVNGCLGVCDRAPIVKIGDEYFDKLTVGSFNDMLQRVIARGQAAEVHHGPIGFVS